MFVLYRFYHIQVYSLKLKRMFCMTFIMSGVWIFVESFFFFFFISWGDHVISSFIYVINYIYKFGSVEPVRSLKQALKGQC